MTNIFILAWNRQFVLVLAQQELTSPYIHWQISTGFALSLGKYTEYVSISYTRHKLPPHTHLFLFTFQAKMFGFIWSTWGNTSYIPRDKLKQTTVLQTCWGGTEGSRGLFNASKLPFFSHTELTALWTHTSAFYNWFYVKGGSEFQSDADKSPQNCSAYLIIALSYSDR